MARQEGREEKREIERGNEREGEVVCDGERMEIKRNNVVDKMRDTSRDREEIDRRQGGGDKYGERLDVLK